MTEAAAGTQARLGPASSAFPPQAMRKLPRSQFLTIEYPGILRAARTSGKGRENAMDIGESDEDEDEDDEEDEDEDLDTGPLGRALSSLSPVPPPYNHPGSALDHIADVLHRNTRVLECRLGASTATSDTHETAARPALLDPVDVYRHPIVGDIVPTHDILCKITKRVWRPVRRRSRAQPGGTAGASDAVEEVKEYKVDLLGPVANTVRFRRMADFVFQPDIAPDIPGSPAPNDQVIRNSAGKYGGKASGTRSSAAYQDAPGQSGNDSSTVELGGSVSVLRLQSMLRRMDFDAISKFRFAEPSQRYEEVVGKTPQGEDVKRATTFLIPPPIFSRQEVPWPYYYKHSGGSRLITYPKADGSTERRYMNTQHYRGVGPTGIDMSALKPNSKVPQGPDHIHLRQLVYVDKDALARLRELSELRPIWSKMALTNQFGPSDPVNSANAKFYMPQIGYIIYDSVFRDCIVRYGYDVRKEPGSRFYQRLQFHFRNEQHVKPQKPSAIIQSASLPSGLQQRVDTSSSSSPSKKGKGRATEDELGGDDVEKEGDHEEDDDDEEEDHDDEGVHNGEDDDHNNDIADSGDDREAAPEDAAEPTQQGDASNRIATETIKRSSRMVLPAGSGTGARRGGSSARRTAHIFDGVSLTAFTLVGGSNYSIIDVTDPMVQDYIRAEGAINLRTSFDLKTGWYTRVAWERIKTAITARVRAVRFLSKPATRAEVEQAVLTRMQDLKRGLAGVQPGAGEAGWKEVSAEVMADPVTRDSWYDGGPLPSGEAMDTADDESV